MSLFGCGRIWTQLQCKYFKSIFFSHCKSSVCTDDMSMVNAIPKTEVINKQNSFTTTVSPELWLEQWRFKWILCSCLKFTRTPDTTTWGKFQAIPNMNYLRQLPSNLRISLNRANRNIELMLAQVYVMSLSSTTSYRDIAAALLASKIEDITSTYQVYKYVERISWTSCAHCIQSFRIFEKHSIPQPLSLSHPSTASASESSLSSLQQKRKRF